MSGALEGLQVLDLSWGTAGPMTTMFLADHGADVIRIEPPDGAPFEEPQGYRVWNRGKRSAILDLRQRADVDTFLALAAGADIVVETFAPGVADKLGVGYDTLAELNPRLIYCAITGYGRDTRDAGRPAFDQLVAARVGFQYELRGFYGSPMERIQGKDSPTPDWELSKDLVLGSDRDGPIFTATAVASVASAYLASVGIQAALHAREVTGVGQRVDTSMLQALIQFQSCQWQRPANLDFPGYQNGMLDRRQIWGTVKVKDGWVNMWGATGHWAVAAAQGDELQVPDQKEVMERAMAARMGGMKSTNDSFAEAVPYLTKFTRDEWTEIAKKARFGLHPVRSPEEALTDPLSFADGSVAEVDDPELGTLRMAGILYRLHNKPTKPRGPAPKRGQHTDEIKALAAGAGTPKKVGRLHAPPSKGPLEGIRVLDFGFAVAGPWTSQVLADLGADVLTIDAPGYHAAWPLNHMGMGVNKSKRHVTLDIKNPEARPVLEDLLRSADILTHNMRPGAAERLGIEYDKVKAINPRIVYLHTRAFEDGPRSQLGGHDQAGNALGGTVYEDGGMANGGRAFFGVGSGGDLGNGYLGAIACLQALYDRDRTGEGQKVDTSILNAALFNNSRVYTTPDGKLFDREKLDADQTGFSALYRIYKCADDQWLCLAVLSDRHWDALVSAIPDVSSLRDDDKALAAKLTSQLASKSAADWFSVLDGAGVPCEVSSLTYSKGVFDDSELIERGWVVHTTGHPNMGDMDMFGIGIDFSETPSKPGGPAPMPGQHTKEVLRELGYDDTHIDKLMAAGAIEA